MPQDGGLAAAGGSEQDAEFAHVAPVGGVHVLDVEADIAQRLDLLPCASTKVRETLRRLILILLATRADLRGQRGPAAAGGSDRRRAGRRHGNSRPSSKVSSTRKRKAATPMAMIPA